jgi:hypothetical protein
MSEPMNAGDGGTLTLNNVQGNGASQWVSLYAANGDASYRTMTVRSVPASPFMRPRLVLFPILTSPSAVSVNGGAAVTVQQPDTGSASTPLSVPIKLTLKSGANTIVFAAGQTSESVDA